MKFLLIVLTLIATLSTTLLLMHHQPVQATTISTNLTIDRILPLATLTTLKVEIADVTVTTIPGKTGSVRAILIAKGDITLGVDLAKASIHRTDASHITITLPQPRVQMVRLDHDKTRLIDLQSRGLWSLIPTSSTVDTAIMNQALRESQHIVEGAGNSPELFARCRLQTEQVLSVFLQLAGQTVECHWQ